jgi:hypothetical protein
MPGSISALLAYQTCSGIDLTDLAESLPVLLNPHSALTDLLESCAEADGPNGGSAADPDSAASDCLTQLAAISNDPDDPLSTLLGPLYHDPVAQCSCNRDLADVLPTCVLDASMAGLGEIDLGMVESALCLSDVLCDE